VRRALALSLACLGAAGSVYACGRSERPHAHPDPKRWLAVDATRRRLTITLVAAYDRAASGLNLDGAVKGALSFDAPTGWEVDVRCLNNASAMRYACALLPAPGVQVSSPPVAGSGGPVAPGAGAGFAFRARQPAAYRLTAVLDGRPVSGMWVSLRVADGARPRARWLR
jgi:hypothetical protein